MFYASKMILDAAAEGAAAHAKAIDRKRKREEAAEYSRDQHERGRRRSAVMDSQKPSTGPLSDERNDVVDESQDDILGAYRAIEEAVANLNEVLEKRGRGVVLLHYRLRDNTNSDVPIAQRVADTLAAKQRSKTDEK